MLRIIDNKDLIAGARARESFHCGFWLAWRLLSQLHNYDSGRSVEGILNVGGRFVMQEGERGTCEDSRGKNDNIKGAEREHPTVNRPVVGRIATTATAGYFRPATDSTNGGGFERTSEGEIPMMWTNSPQFMFVALHSGKLCRIRVSDYQKRE